MSASVSFVPPGPAGVRPAGHLGDDLPLTAWVRGRAPGFRRLFIIIAICAVTVFAAQLLRAALP